MLYVGMAVQKASIVVAYAAQEYHADQQQGYSK
jgi:hypothetical protein